LSTAKCEKIENPGGAFPAQEKIYNSFTALPPFRCKIIPDLKKGADGL